MNSLLTHFRVMLYYWRDNLFFLRSWGYLYRDCPCRHWYTSMSQLMLNKINSLKDRWLWHRARRTAGSWIFVLNMSKASDCSKLSSPRYQWIYAFSVPMQIRRADPCERVCNALIIHHVLHVTALHLLLKSFSFYRSQAEQYQMWIILLFTSSATSEVDNCTAVWVSAAWRFTEWIH